MSDQRLKRTRKTSLPHGDDPRDRSSVGDSMTASALGPGLELVGGKIALKISPDSPFYTDEQGYVHLRTGPGLLVARGSPMCLQLQPADASVEVVSKGLRARPRPQDVVGFSSAVAVVAAATVAAGARPAGVSVIQVGSKSTGVAVPTRAGTILMDAAALGAGAAVVFTVTYADCSADDVPQVAVRSGGTAGAYLVGISAVATGSFDIVVVNRSAGPLSEAVRLNYLVEKGASS